MDLQSVRDACALRCVHRYELLFLAAISGLLWLDSAAHRKITGTTNARVSASTLPALPGMVIETATITTGPPANVPSRPVHHNFPLLSVVARIAANDTPNSKKPVSASIVDSRRINFAKQSFVNF
ncbi:hypothetical protein [Paraburkholderia phenoliruptrix]|uniref:hypothetical protein n=1 Tax=Paraburkholderia phenoliruptrix TaxID=252970 RepID=UPI0034CF89DB